ncbi:MAG: translation initiation factor IF-2 [Desulfobacteraceae bacterium 4572_187]|nr:MAG: translation initiation factor IF-2 [Desulfobacteraceae bacterium 4572_187]RLB86031.1 MAG: translation initiation factor IF-2 [Deltaproteobacteria bacterium]
MAKIRIYELARDLNVTNKELLEKISNMDINVKSHMSSLDDEDVTRIKKDLLGSPKKEVDEKRIKPTIIRRRKKRVRQEPVKVETAIEPEQHPEKTAIADQASEKALKEKEIPPVKEPEKLRKTEVPEPVAKEKKAPGKEKEDASDGAVAQPIVLKEKHKVEQPVALKKLKIKKTGKKIKKDVPAKIIKLPVTPPLEKKAPEIEKDRVHRLKTKVAKTPAPKKDVPESKTPRKDVPVKDKKKKKKWTKKPDEVVRDKKFFKKKISFRKKEVVEGADLYIKGHRIRKGRKIAKAKPTFVKQKPLITTPKAIKRRIKIDEFIALSDLAKRMGIKAGEIIKKLMDLGVMTTVNQIIDFDTAVLVATEFDYELEKASFEEETVLNIEMDDPDKLIQRPPVVTIMGHVDHGKTSLLDVIRKTKVTENEAGGITQHIGAYNVSIDKNQIVFLDTPGHEAFTEMRARGAKVTDLVILVVAADDGVMPQTLEAINHSKAAKVPIIVAINKIDKENAEPERVQRELADAGLVPEDWGGDTIFVQVSAKEKHGIDDLLEMILLQAEILELKANPNKLAMGYVVEAKLDSGRGPVATILVKQGTLKIHDPVVCGVHYGKIRALQNDMGVQVTSAGPSMPVEIIGLSGVPNAGDKLLALADEKNAKQVSAHRIQKQRSKELAKTGRLSLEKFYEQIQTNEVKDLNIIIKADVHGSIEALEDALTKLSNEEVRINVIHSATGTLTESDISLATVSDAIIIGFNVRPTSKIQALAHEENVDIRFYNVIYDIIKDVKDAILGMMSSTFEERVLGKAEVREVFHVPKVGAIAGCYVIEGKIKRGQLARVLRDWIVCYEGKISSLRHFKDDVKEVQIGYECGIGIQKYNDIKVGDIIECYYFEEIKPELEE